MRLIQLKLFEFFEEQTGLHIEVLSGPKKHAMAILGVINTIDIRDGLIIDIGGGSTEVTLLQDRKLVHSFPFLSGR